VAELTIYEKRTCTTCRKLAALLDERGIDFERIDFHVEPLTEPEIRELVRKTGEPRATCSAGASRWSRS
jgi:arsenate reductase (glutaredoxin)